MAKTPKIGGPNVQGFSAMTVKLTLHYSPLKKEHLKQLDTLLVPGTYLKVSPKVASGDSAPSREYKADS